MLYYEYYKLNLKSFLTDSIYNNYLTSNAVYKNGGGEYAEEGEPIFMVNSNVGAGFYGMKIDSKLSSVTLNANIFNTVDKVKITAAAQWNKEFTNDTYLYFTQNIGLIKTETVLGTNNIEAWSLKRWKIIK